MPATDRVDPTREATMEDRLLAERIVDQLFDAVIYANRPGEIVRWNRASISLLGFVPAEALGRSLDLIIPEQLRAEHSTRR